MVIMTKEQRQMIEYTTEEVKYGVTELEAINILNGKCISDYVEKYNRIKNLISLNVKKNTKDEVEDK